MTTTENLLEAIAKELGKREGLQIANDVDCVFYPGVCAGLMDGGRVVVTGDAGDSDGVTFYQGDDIEYAAYRFLVAVRLHQDLEELKQRREGVWDNENARLCDVCGDAIKKLKTLAKESSDGDNNKE